jgi:2-methylcitrate dehydratase PrpD
VKAAVDPALRAATAHSFQSLCAWASQARSQPLPNHVRYRAALVLLDDLGAIIAASSEPEIEAARRRAHSQSSAQQATIFAQGAPRVGIEHAAAMNGMAVAWAELDEGYRLAPCHAGAYILPALLAAIEHEGGSVADLLHILAIAYDVTGRFARAFPFSTMTVHPHAAFATVGAATGIALLRGLKDAEFASALSGAASMTPAGPYAHAIDGALIRNAWSAAGAWLGLQSVDWAQCGIGGIPETAYDVFVTCLGAEARPHELDDRLGDIWAIEDGYHKIFACCQYAHSALEASLELHQRLGDGASDAIDSIIVETHPRGLTLTGVDPATVLAAKFSMPHALAAVAVRKTGGKDAFSNDTLDDPAIAALRHRVELKPYEPLAPWPLDRPGRVTWIMKDGSEHRAECVNARGGADQPFDEETLLAKLQENCGAIFPAMPPLLQQILAGSPEILNRPWRDVVTHMVRSS